MAAKLVEVQTWVGYTEEGNKVGPFTAASAKKDINPDDVKAKIVDVKNACDDELTDISTALNKLEDDALNALRVEGMTLQDYIDQISEILDNFGAQIAEKLEPLYEKAVEEHNRLQNDYNEKAEEKASNGTTSRHTV